MKLLISILAAVSLIVTGVPALRVNAQDISNEPISFPFGVLNAGSTTETGLDYFTVTNHSTSDVTITIRGTDMSGGDVTWELSDTATQGENRYGLMAGLETFSYDIIVKKTETFNTLVSGLPASQEQKWGLQLLAPTSFTDGEEKTGTVTLTAALD